MIRHANNSPGSEDDGELFAKAEQ